MPNDRPASTAAAAAFWGAPAAPAQANGAPSPALARSWRGLCGVGHPGFVAFAAVAPTIPMTVPTVSAVTARKFGGSCSGQALALWLFLPVRPGIGADDSASRAYHARAERWHWHVIGPRVRAHDRPVVALPA
jgi:hypothetical protein